MKGKLSTNRDSKGRLDLKITFGRKTKCEVGLRNPHSTCGSPLHGPVKSSAPEIRVEEIKNGEWSGLGLCAAWCCVWTNFNPINVNQA